MEKDKEEAMGNDKDKVIEGSLVKREESAIAPYGDFDLGMMEDAEKSLPTGDKRFYEARDGKNVIRFIPPLQGKKPFKIWNKHHFSAGGEKKAIICTKQDFNEPCELCKMRLKLASSASPKDQKQARAYEPRATVYCNVVDMMEPEKGVQVFRIPSGLFKSIRKAIDMAEVGKVFAHPEKGFNIKFVKTGTGLKTKYETVTVAREASPLPNAAELIANQLDLDGMEAAPTDEEVDEAVDGEFEVTPSRKERERKEKRGGGDSKGGGDDDDDEDLDY